MYKHINPKSEYITDLIGSIGIEIFVELFESFSTNYEQNCKRIKESITKNDFSRIVIHGHTVSRDFAMFLDKEHPAKVILNEFEDVSKQKSYEHKNNDFVKNDVDFASLFADVQKQLKEPVEEIRQFIEELKTQIRSS
jgi:hypothetical protein